MDLKEFMILNNFIYIGKMAAFYVPSNKLGKKEFGENGETPKVCLVSHIS